MIYSTVHNFYLSPLAPAEAEHKICYYTVGILGAT